jgi:mannose-6-phosphate isomerase-like protein (cupin superfamily)
MRALFFAATMVLLSLPAGAQVISPPKLYASPVETAAAERAARAATTMVPQVLVSNPPYRAVLEWRGKPTPASLHETVDELISVTGGEGTLIIGGKLRDEKRRDATNLTGNGIAGGTPYRVAKGSFFIIPAGTPHYFSGMGSDGLTIISMHMPSAKK